VVNDRLHLYSVLRRRYIARVKTFSPSVALLLLLVSVPSVEAAKKTKPASVPPAVAQPNTAQPTEALAPYINNLEELLSLERPGKKNARPLLTQASGRIATLRQGFIAQRAQAAPEQKGKFQAAIATCDSIASALDERQKAAGDLDASQAVRGTSKLDQGPRKDNLAQGIKGGDKAKAVGAVVERDRERAAAKAAKNRAAAGDDALTAMAENRWNKRSLELRQQIMASYSRIQGAP
jgi:hypothetical protein